MSLDRLANAARKVFVYLKSSGLDEFFKNVLNRGYTDNAYNNNLSDQFDKIDLSPIGEGFKSRYPSQFYIYERIHFNRFSSGSYLEEIKNIVNNSNFESVSVTNAKLIILESELSNYYGILRAFMYAGSANPDPADGFEAEIGVNWNLAGNTISLSDFHTKLKNIEYCIEEVATVYGYKNVKPVLTGLANVDPFITIGTLGATAFALLKIVKLVQENIENYYSIKKVKAEAERAGIDLGSAKIDLAAKRRELAELVVDGASQGEDLDQHSAARLVKVAEKIIDELAGGARFGASFSPDLLNDTDSLDADPHIDKQQAIDLAAKAPFELPIVETQKGLLKDQRSNNVDGSEV